MTGWKYRKHQYPHGKETIASLPEAERLAIRYTAAFKKDGKPLARTGTHSGLFDQWEGCP